ncbi:unnamed protein product [Prorocentrum cordatum]|uniref:Uncharacterized protein n=1 Tax=Prorocentrum cordatum TaxID=2364126 RepID=A0ABN9YFX5_9DINO|nr:unnamed protein product [Polarella glacialis]
MTAFQKGVARDMLHHMNYLLQDQEDNQATKTANRTLGDQGGHRINMADDGHSRATIPATDPFNPRTGTHGGQQDQAPAPCGGDCCGQHRCPTSPLEDMPQPRLSTAQIRIADKQTPRGNEVHRFDQRHPVLCSASTPAHDNNGEEYYPGYDHTGYTTTAEQTPLPDKQATATDLTN